MKLKELLDRQDDMMWFRVDGAPYLGSQWSADYLGGDERTMRALAPYLDSDVVSFWPEIFENPETGDDAPMLAIYTSASGGTGRPKSFWLKCSCCGDRTGREFATREEAERAACDAGWVCMGPVYLCPRCQDGIANRTVKATFERKEADRG